MNNLGERLAMRTPSPPLVRRRRSRSLSPQQQQRKRDYDRERNRRHRADPEHAAVVAAATEADKERKRKLRASSRAERTEVAASMLLERVHDASGSVITANSMRLPTLLDGPARQVAREDVKRDIARYVHVPLETKASCVSDYMSTRLRSRSSASAPRAGCATRPTAVTSPLTSQSLCRTTGLRWARRRSSACVRCRQWRFCAALRAKATRRSAYHTHRLVLLN